MATQKLKTRKAVTKRFKLTKSGKVLRRAVGQDHGRMKKTGKQKRKMRKWVVMSTPETKKIKKLITG
jgi:large subunit ribosomal protein L35